MANRRDINRMKKFLMGTHAAEAVEVAEQLRDAIFGKDWSEISDVDAQKIVANKHELWGVQLKLTQISENFMERTEDTIYSEAAEKDLGMAYGYIHAAWELLQAAKLMLDGVLKGGSLEEEEEKEMKMEITNETMANPADMVMNGEKPTHLGPRGRVVIELAINDILDIAKRLEYAGEALTEDEGSDGTAYRGDDGVRIDKVYHYLEAARDLVHTASDELADILRRADK